MLGRGHRFLSMGSPHMGRHPENRPAHGQDAGCGRVVVLFTTYKINWGVSTSSIDHGLWLRFAGSPIGGHRVPSPPYKRTRPWRPALSGYKPRSAGRHGSARVSTSSETIQNWRVGHRSTRTRSVRRPRSKKYQFGPITPARRAPTCSTTESSLIIAGPRRIS